MNINLDKWFNRAIHEWIENQHSIANFWHVKLMAPNGKIN